MTGVFERVTDVAGLVAIGTACFVTVIMAITQSIIRLRKSEYDLIEMKARLSAYRESLDTKIGNLSIEGLATPSRWKDANHLVVTAADRNANIIDPHVEPNAFLRSYGMIESDLDVDTDLIFVLTPFNKQEDETFNSIRDICARMGYRAVRGDEENAEGEVFAHILRQILKSRLVIANVASRNSNVFYELGIAHALSKPTIIVSRTISDAPFDIANKRIIVYKNTDELEKELVISLLQFGDRERKKRFQFESEIDLAERNESIRRLKNRLKDT